MRRGNLCLTIEKFLKLESLSDLQTTTTLKNLILMGWDPELYEEAVLEGLESHFTLQMLQISGFPPHLKVLHINGYPKLMHLPPFPSSLQVLSLENCSLISGETLTASLQEPADSLKEMSLVGLPSIESLSLGPHLIALKKLYISDLRNLRSLESLPSLRELTIDNCPKMESLSDLQTTTTLKTLNLWGCNREFRSLYVEGGPLHHQLAHISHVSIE